MLYTWDDPTKQITNKSPPNFLAPRYSFTALIPARHEEDVIYDTVQAVATIDYPERFKEAFIICREDDTATINEAKRGISDSKKTNIHLITHNDSVINKPHNLNIGLKRSTKDIVAVFDAEDEPHPEIYRLVNTTLIKKHADVVQAGIQLMNYRSSWFSALNVMEYFFWFKSSLHLFSSMNAIPLGGNSVFFKRMYLEMIEGWNEDCLTEDADIGFRLCSVQAKIQVVYSEQYVTREETPPTTRSFIKQRTRWTQGFLQILAHGTWMNLESTRQKSVALYILSWPIMQSVLLLLTPILIITTITTKMPITVVLLSFLPIYTLIFQIVIYNVGLFLFTRYYFLPYHLSLSIILTVGFIPYQLLLSYSALRAVIRIIAGKKGWEKTLHVNAHRKQDRSFIPYAQSFQY